MVPRSGVLRPDAARGSLLARRLQLIVAILCFLVSVNVHGMTATFNVEMRFKKGDEEEKTNRLMQLHQFQVAQLRAEEEEAQAAQVVQLISNKDGGQGSFTANFSLRSSLITAPVSFGRQVFDVTLDTGSTVLWVTSTSCTSSACKAHPRYDPSTSRTYSKLEPATEFEVEYGSGYIRGTLAFETVGLGYLQIPSQSFGLVTEQQGSTFERAQWSGLLGLAYPSLAAFEHVPANHTKPFFDSIMASKLLNHNAFSFWLVRSALTPPMFFMGAPPPEYYQGTLEFFDVVEKYHWTLRLMDILVDGKSLGLCPPPNHCKVAVDSGTTYMAAPTDDLPAILGELSDGHPDATCYNQTTKIVTYVLEGNRTLTLEPEFYYTKSYTGDVCKIKYVGLDVDPPRGPLHIFGEPLFRKYFVHFNRDSDQVGFAVAREAAEAKPSLRSLIVKKLLSLI